MSEGKGREMPREMTAFEIFKAVEELQWAVGSIVKKVYTRRGRKLVLRIFSRKGELDLVFMPGYVFSAPKAVQQTTPEPFAMFIRKRVSGARITSISQVNGDRIVKLSFSPVRTEMVVELFRDFNVILLEEGRIISAMTYGEWKDRAIKRGLPYSPPPVKEWDDMAGKRLEAYLTVRGFGRPYSLEFLERLGNPDISEADRKEVEALMDEMRKRETRPVMAGRDYAVIPVHGFSGTPVSTISEIFHVLHRPEGGEGEGKGKAGKAGRIALAMKKLEQKLARVEEKVSWIESHPEIYAEFERARAERRGREFLSGPLRLSLLKPLREQLSEIYEERKRLRRKLEKAREMVEKAGKEKTGHGERKRKEGKEKAGEWMKIPRSMERFRVFNYGKFAFILGKDADTNEELVKRHASKSPVIAHAFVDGSPFGIAIGELPEGFEDMLCSLVACYSRAWKSGIGMVEAYWVKPEQVSKKAPAGEYLSKGSFMVYGRKNTVKAELKLCFCNSAGRLVVGPEGLVSRICGKYVCITPGSMKARDAAKLIRNRIGREIGLADIEKFIPYGSCEVLV